MIYIGIDPGVSGAIAAISCGGSRLTVEDMPVFKIKRGKTQKREVDVATLARMLDGMAAQSEVRQQMTRLVLEQGGTRPKEGVSSARQGGVNWGVVYGVIVALRIPVVIVPANTWKKAMKATSDKDLSRRLACQTFPDYTNQFSRSMDHGRAEAALMAEYGRRVDVGVVAAKVAG